MLPAHQVGSDRRADEHAAGGHGPQPDQHFVNRIFFENVALCATVHGLVEDGLLGVERQHDHPGRMWQRPRGAEQIHSAHAWQIQVHHGDRGPQRFDLLKGGRSIVGLADDHKATVSVDGLPKPQPEDRMIVHNDGRVLALSVEWSWAAATGVWPRPRNVGPAFWFLSFMGLQVKSCK